jgi:hypothetical protein
MVREVLLEANNNNLGAIILKGHTWTDAEGKTHPVVVFRSGFLPKPGAPDSCYQSLLTQGHVRHVLNLYDGKMKVDDLVAAEAAAAAAQGAMYVEAAKLDYGEWRYALKGQDPSAKGYKEAVANLARLLKEQILMPGGKPPQGNILVHCGGGMHRTGMIIGVLEKVINGEDPQVLADRYRYHVGFGGPDNPGGFEQKNLDVILGFDPALLGK